MNLSYIYVYLVTAHIQADDTLLCESDKKSNPGLTNVSTEEHVSDSESRMDIGNTSLQSNVDTSLHSENEANKITENSRIIVKTEPFTPDALFGNKYNQSETKTEVSFADDSLAEFQTDTELTGSESPSKCTHAVRNTPKKTPLISPKKRKDCHTENQKRTSIKTTVINDKRERKKMLREHTELSAKKTNNYSSEKGVKNKNLETILSGDSGSSSKLKIYCDDCKRTFTGRKRYENHLIDGKCYWECEFCGRTFHHRNKTSYEVHLKLHRNEYDYQCQECGMAFVTKHNLVRHQQGRHATDRPHSCDKCSYRFHTKASLYRHIEKTHSEGDGINRCPKCSKCFDLPSQLQTHLEKRHLDPDIPCSVCGKLVRPTSLWRHEASHKESKDFKCDHCPAAFKFKAELVVHKKRHTKEYSDYCEHCGKGFYGSNPLKIHRRIHTGEKPYACSLCDYRCALKGNLKLHMKVHEKLI